MVSASAAGTTVNTALVGLEAIARGVDCNSDRTAIDGTHHGGVVARDVFVATSVDFTFRCTVLASSLLSSVGVRRFLLSFFSLEIRKDFVSPTSITTVAACVAIDFLLRSEFIEGSSLDAIRSFDGFSSCESPA